MIRSFLAIEIPEDQKETVAGYIQELRQVPSKMKWVLPHQTHFTLKFFGSITSETVEKISQTLSLVVSEFPKFHLTLEGIGAFPNLFRPRVIWLGLGGRRIASGEFTGALIRPSFLWASLRKNGLSRAI